MNEICDPKYPLWRHVNKIESNGPDGGNAVIECKFLFVDCSARVKIVLSYILNFFGIFIYLPYRRILVFGKCRITVSPYRYRRISIPYRCNIDGDGLAKYSVSHIKSVYPVIAHGVEGWL